MTHTHSSVAEIFSEAVALRAGDERAAYLDSACGTNSELRKRVERLLQADNKAHDFLESPAIRPADTIATVGAESPGTLIGPYKLLQQIGEGGMGTVYMAEQEQPVRRKVALKVIKPGMDSGQVIARFEAERQALALMDHVNIARVLDAGTTEQGRPYFVMELVNGVSITRYCDDNRLTPRQRLELFVPVCQAIQHAHQKGIIHRDIKPSNVMVTLYDGKPVPKVIDFGVAKATEQKLTERTLFTHYGTMVGTLEYMSPEQAEMSALGVDTRSDIYSLGVLLYELLTGSTPLSRERIKEAAFAEILRLIKDEEPPRPSTRISESGEALASISAQRSTEPASLSKLMRGELDWIVMKCLEKDRNRRYETATGFAADVQRYLSDEPVLACPPTAGYRMWKFVRRNKGTVSAAAVVLAALLIGIAGTTWGLVQAQQGRVAADKSRQTESAERARAVASLYDSLISEARALRLARATGYREQAWQRLRQAAALETSNRDLNTLRMEAAANLGDFAGLRPAVIEDFGEATIRAIALNPQAPQLALGFSDGSLRILHLPDGEEISHWLAHPTAAIDSVAFDASGQILASAAMDGTVTVWFADESAKWTRQWTSPVTAPTILGNGTSAVTVLFTADRQQVAVCSSGASAIDFLSTVDGQDVRRLETHALLSGHMALSPDGSLLAAGAISHGEHSVIVWQTATGVIVRNFPSDLDMVYVVTFSPDGRLLAWGCEAGVAICDTNKFERQLFFRGSYTESLNFSHDSEMLAFGRQDAIILWDIVTNREIATVVQPSTQRDRLHSEHVLAVAASFDDRIIFSASSTSVAMWDLDAASEKLLLKRFAGGIPSLEFSPDGHLLASVSKDKSVTLWDPHTGQLVHNLIGCQGAVQALAFSPDGRWLATGDWSGRESVRIWDVASGHCLLAIDPKLPEVWSVAFSGDGRYFAIAAHPGWIIWKIEKEDGNENVQLGAIVHSVTTASTVNGVCFTADSSLLAWVERDLSFHLWDVEAARAVEPPLNRLGSFVNSVRMDTSAVGMPGRGKWLWLWTGVWEIWDMASGKKIGPAVYPAEFKTLPKDSKWGWCRAISPDQSRLAVGQADGSLELWDLTRVRARLIESGLGWGQGHDPPPAAQ